MGKRIICLIVSFVFVVLSCSFPSFVSITKAKAVQIKLLPILLDFTDVPHQRTEAEMFEFFFSEEEGVKSLHNYYTDVTRGKVEIKSGAFGVGTWLKLPQKKRFYNNQSSIVQVAQDAADIIEKQKLDFSEYDSDNDGYLDFVVFIQAGDPVKTGQGSFWPHSYSLRGAVSINGLKIDRYNMNAEIYQSNKLQPLQIICHECYHYLGGWDLYSYRGKYRFAVGPWDIMAETNDFKIFGLSGFSRNYLGWQETTLITKPGTYSVDALCEKNVTNPQLYRINLEGTKEYFLIENRNFSGVDAWWQGIPDEGIVIYHVDGGITPTHMFNDGPDVYEHFAVWVEDPGAGTMKKDAAYSQEDNQVNLTPNSRPDSKDYEKKAQPHVSITNISKSGKTMTFDVSFEYIDPHLVVTPDKIDIGKLPQGLTKTVSVLISNNGTGTLNTEVRSKETWISTLQNEYQGNQQTVELLIDASSLTNGKKKGRVDFLSNGGNVTVTITVEIVSRLGDVNNDGQVDEDDIPPFMKAFGTKKGDPDFNPRADFNDDNVVNFEDLSILAKSIQ